MKAAIYTRYSTDKQSSTADQMRVCEQLAEREGLQVVARFSDEGISGGTATRPGYQALLAGARAGAYTMIVAEDASRLWRNMAEQSPRLAELRDLGVQVVTCNFDTRHEEAADWLGAILGTAGAVYRKEIGRRVRRTAEGKARAGEPTGGRAYGYTSKREVIPEQAAIVREIFARFAGGDSMMAIAHDLNRRGIPSPGAAWGRKARRRDGAWLISALHAMLKNEVYTGKLVWNKRTWVRSSTDSSKRKAVLNSPDRWIVHERPDLRLVDEVTWNRAQRRLTERRDLYKTGSGGKAQYLLSGLLRCGVCGAAYVISAHRPVRYACSTYRYGGPAACPNDKNVRRDIAEEAILPPVIDRLLSDEVVEHCVKAMRKWASEASRAEPAEVEAIDRELDKLQELSGVLSPMAIAAARRELQEQRRKLVREFTPIVANGLFGAETAYRETVAEMRGVLAGDDCAAARDALRELIGEIPLRPEGDHLVAELSARPVALAVNWNGSGGSICPQFQLRLPAGKA